MLSTQSSKILNGLLGLEPSNIKSQKLDWDSIFQLAAESVKTGSVKLSPEKKCFMFSEQFLQTQSPFLINARGFKTRSSNTDKPFVKSKSSEAEADDSYADVLKHLNISPAEKEKVTIALSMASVAGNKKTEDTKTDNNATKGKNKFLNFGGSNNQGGGRFWMFLSKTATILIILSTLIALSQFFQIGYGFRIGKGTNEIAPEDIDVRTKKVD